jgi:branched-subunit amino acid aminotransferase/4-amino-4-deoxychorismate lyase
MNFFYSAHPEGEFTLSPIAHPWLRGDGIFETIKSEKGSLFFLDRHLTRLLESARGLLFAAPAENFLREKIDELILRTSGIDRGRFRVTLFSNGEFLLSHENAPLRTTPQKLKVSSTVRYSQSALSGRKSLSYGEGSFGLRLAEKEGFDDLLYLNERNEVVETGLANILIEKKGKFATPEINSGCLPGIVRGVLLDWFKEVKETDITIADIKEATGLYVLSSMREIDLVTELCHSDGRIQRFGISAAAEKLRADYLINSRSQPNS